MADVMLIQDIAKIVFNRIVFKHRGHDRAAGNL